MSSARKEIMKELSACVLAVSDGECEAFIGYFDKGRSLFFAGAGRSGLAVRGFAMRAMHLGYTTHVIGDVSTPAIKENDLLLIASGSGNTESLVSMATKAKALGAKILLLTINPSSKIGKMADSIIQIPAPSPKVDEATDFTSIQPMGTLAEQTMNIVFDSLVLDLMKKNNTTSEEMFKNHANLE